MIPMYQHPLYCCWRSMRARCLRPYDKSYARYGGRGITVCAEWGDFWTFVNDMGERPAGCGLDRIDNDGPYAPWNCKWSTPAEQQKNTKTTRLIEVDGEKLCVADWARRFGVTPSAISHQIRRLGPEAAIRRFL